ncbi:MAG TPA: hypothetical protein VFZ24_17685 [Longimicrobiales bacterium]
MSAVKRPLRVTRLNGAIAVGLLAVLVYLPALRNGFAYDDVPIIANNTRVTEFDVGAILGGGYWEDTNTALYRPLATLSYAVDWRLSGGSPVWFHLVNAFWHAAATALLFLLLLAAGAIPAGALIGAAVFAVHPLHVEAVANVVGRAELLAAAFTLAAALLWCRPARWLRSAAGIAGLVALFVLALASKEGAVVLPGVLALTDIGRGRLRAHRIGDWLRVRLRPLVAVAAVLVLFFALRAVLLSVVVPAALDPSLEVLSSRSHRFYTALQAWPHYLRLMFYPRILLNEYSPRITLPMTSITPAVLAGALILGGCLAGGLFFWARGRALAALSLLWFPVTVFPVSNLVVPIGVLVAERTLYLPSAALAIGIAALAPLLARAPLPRLRPAVPALTAVALALLIARSVTRIADWRSTNTIFSALVRDRPDNFRGVWHFARLATAQRQPAVALTRYGEAIELWPYRRGLIVEAALNAVQHGAPDYAFRLTEYGIGQWPTDLALRRVHAGLLLDRADTAGAYRHVRAGLDHHPRDSVLNLMLQVTRPAIKLLSEDSIR